MLFLLAALLLVATIGSLSLLLAYYVTVITGQRTLSSEPAYNALIGLEVGLLVQNAVNTIGDVATVVASTTLRFVADARANFKRYLIIAIMLLLCTAYITDRDPFLQSLDKFWRCGVHPFYDNILYAIVQVLRVFYGAIMPILNYELVVLSQLVQGSFTVVIRCNIQSFFESLKIILDIFISNFDTIATWSGVGTDMSIDNNPVTNEYNVTNVVLNVQALVLKQSEVTSCICGGLTDVFEFVFLWFRQDELAHAINHAVNVPISLVQSAVQTVPPWSKNVGLLPTISHLNGALFYLGSYADQVLMKSILHLISLFDERLKVSNLPKEFLFTIASRLAMAGVHAGWVLVRVAFMFGPLLSMNGLAYESSGFNIHTGNLLETFDLDHVMENINIAVVTVTDVVNWVMKIVETLGVSVDRAVTNEAAPALPPYGYVVCSEQNTDKIDQLTCAMRYSLHLIPDIAYTAYSCAIELLFNSIVLQQDSFVQILQRYDGISYPREEELTCEYRQSIDYDFTAKTCRCDPGLGVYYPLTASEAHPYGVVHYDRYCGQPNLAVNLFGQVDRIMTYAIGTFSENLKNVISAGVKAGLELPRAVVKAALNIEDIISGSYFSMKVNCGYGMSSSQLRLWWNSTDNTTTLAQKFTNQRAFMYDKFSIGHCDGPDQLGYISPVDGLPKCKLTDTTLKDMMCLATSNPSGKIIEGGYTVPMCTEANHAGCECNFALANICKNKSYGARGTLTIAFNLTEAECLRNATEGEPVYVDGVIVQCPNKYVNGVPTNGTAENCLQTERSGTYVGPIDPLNQCKCIRNFPDKLMEWVEGAFDNPILSRFHSDDVALHLCNTFWLEPFLYYVGQLSFAIEDSIALFHPAYASSASGNNEYCESKAFVLESNTDIIFDEHDYDANEPILAALDVGKPMGVLAKQGCAEVDTNPGCTVYGTTDFVCSTGLTLRSTITILINELRMVVMAGSKILDGDFTGIQVAFPERLCDLNRVLASFASIVPSLIPDTTMDLKLQAGLTKLIYAGLKYPVLLLNVADRMLVFLQDFITGKLDWGCAVGPVAQLVVDVINILVNWFKLLLRGAGDTLPDDAGEGLDEVADLIETAQDIFLQPDGIAAQLTQLFVKFGMESIALVTGKAQCGGKSCLQEWMSDLTSVLAKMVTLLELGLTKITDFFLKMLGPVGSFLAKLNDAGEGLIDKILCIIIPSSCSSTSSMSSRRRLHSHGIPNVTKIIANTYNWTGTSECDLTVRLYQSYEWDTLRPMEQIKMLECVRDRVRMIELSERWNITLPHDLIYNPDRKWTVLRQLVTSSSIYLRHKLGQLTVPEMLHQFRLHGIDHATFLKLFNGVRVATADIVSLDALGQTIETAVRSIDPNIHASNTSIGHAYRLVGEIQHASVKLHAHAKKRDVHRKLGRSLETLVRMTPTTFIPQVPTHLSHAWDSWDNVRHVPRSPSKSHARTLVLRAAGMITDISPCSDRPNAIVCINCAVVDDFLSAIISSSYSTADYYRFVYAPVTIPSFVKYWSDDYSVAWWEDVGTEISVALQQRSTSLNVQPTDSNTNVIENATSRRRLRTNEASSRLRTNEASRSKRYFERARTDWDWFFFDGGWNPWKTHAHPRSSAPKVFVDFISADETTYVEYFAHSLRYYVSRVFEDCPMEKIYCSANTYEERQRLITDSIHYMLYTTLVLWGVQALFDVPVFSLSLPFLPFVCIGIYFFTVYIYTYACFPSLPNCLVDDLYGYLHDTLFPECFCMYIPGLANSCSIDNCFMCSMSTTYATCGESVPLYTDMGILWAVVTWFRKHYPGSLVFLYKTIPFSWVSRQFPSFVTTIDYIIGDKELTQVELDCLNLSYVDIILVVFIGWLGIQVLTLTVPLLIRTIQHAIDFLILYTTVAYTMVVSLEQQTVIDLEEYNYDE